MSKIEAWAVVNTTGNIVATWDTHYEALENCRMNCDTGECSIIRLVSASEAGASEDKRTLRDWFAGQALAMLVDGSGWRDAEDELAEASYRIADAMLARRASRAANGEQKESE